MRGSSLLLSSALVLASSCRESPVQPTARQASPNFSVARAYTAIDLGTLGSEVSDAEGINEARQVIGASRTASNEYHGFLWDHGRMTDLTPAGGTRSNAIALNNTGQVAVFSRTASDVPGRGFLWDHGTITDLGSLGGTGPYPYDITTPTAINAAGQVAGGSLTMDGHLHAFVWDRGTMTDLGALPGHAFSIVLAMNAAGQMVGESCRVDYVYGPCHAVLWDHGTMTDLGTLSGGLTSARGIDPAGRVVGISATPDGRYAPVLWDRSGITLIAPFIYFGLIAINPRGQVIGTSQEAFLWDRGTLIDLGTLDGTQRSEAFAINPSGQVVGISRTRNGKARAFLWDRGTMIELPALGGCCGAPRAINAAGDIVGWSETADGEIHATLWTR